MQHSDTLRLGLAADPPSTPRPTPSDGDTAAEPPTPSRGWPAPILILGAALAVCLAAAALLILVQTAATGEALSPADDPHGSQLSRPQLLIWGAFLVLAGILVFSWWRCVRHQRRLTEQNDHHRATIESLRHAVKTWCHAAESAQSRADKLGTFNELMLDRENRVIELKEEVNVLSREAGIPAPYPSVWRDSAPGIVTDGAGDDSDTGTLRWWRVQA